MNRQVQHRERREARRGREVSELKRRCAGLEQRAGNLERELSIKERPAPKPACPLCGCPTLTTLSLPGRGTWSVCQSCHHLEKKPSC